MVERFIDDDVAYLDWVAAHPGGYVVNTNRPPSPGYLILHRAGCHTVSGDPTRGQTWTGGDYSKVCSDDRSELSRWAADEVGGELQPCRTCVP